MTKRQERVSCLTAEHEDTATSFEGQCENSVKPPRSSKLVQNKVHNQDFLGKGFRKSWKKNHPSGTGITGFLK